MPINPMIPLGVQPMRLEMPNPNSQMNALAQAMQIKSAMQDQELGRMKMDEYRRNIEDQNALRSALSAPDADPYKVLLGRGMVQQAGQFAQSQAAARKADLDAKKAELEMGLKKAEHVSSVLSLAKDPQTYAQVRQVIAQNYGQTLPEQFDPTFVAATVAQGQTLTQRLKAEHDRLTLEETGRHNRTTEGLTVRGQDITEANNRRSVGAQYAIAQSARDAASINAQATRDAAAIKDKRDTEMKLADDYRTQSKGFKEASEAFKILESTLDKAATSPAATLAAATKFMKQLDPGSVVRESELGMALAASGVIDRLTNYHNTLLRGRVLTPDQVKDFKNIARQVYAASQAVQKQIDENYKRQASQYGLRSDMIVQDIGQNSTPPVDLNSLPSGGKAGGKPRELKWGE